MTGGVCLYACVGVGVCGCTYVCARVSACVLFSIGNSVRVLLFVGVCLFVKVCVCERDYLCVSVRMCACLYKLCVWGKDY